MTLVELMTVMAIMLILLAISVPIVKPIMANRKTAEGARTLESILNRARIRAMELGRPCGVMFERYTDNNIFGADGLSFPNNDACLIVRQVEEPPPYCGSGSGIRVATKSLETLKDDDLAEYNAIRDRYIARLNAGEDLPPLDDKKLFRLFFREWQGSVWGNCQSEYSYWDMMVENNDRIAFDSDSGNYRIVSSSPPVVYCQKQSLNYSGHSPATFKVFRKPQPTLSAPVGFPVGVVVDLEWSGMDNYGISQNNAGGNNVRIPYRGSDFYPRLPNTQSPVIVMFSASGEIDSVVYEDVKTIPTKTVHFLVGHWEKTGIDWRPGEDNPYVPAEYLDPSDPVGRNYLDPSCFWVSIQPRTGLVRTNEVANSTNDENQSQLYNSRRFANDAQFNSGGL